MHAARCAQRPPRRGAAAVEMLLFLPVVLTIIAAMVELSMLLSVQEQLQAACRQGGRVAALGGNEQEVTQAVQNHLGNGNLSTAEVDMAIRDPSGKPLAPGNPIQVWVSIPATAVVPNLLWFIGYDISTETLVARSVMPKE